MAEYNAGLKCVWKLLPGILFFFSFAFIFYSLALASDLRGDANGDGKVDGVDYTIWLNHFGQAVLEGAVDGDFNANGFVDGVDYTIWLNSWGSVLPTGTAPRRTEVGVTHIAGYYPNRRTEGDFLTYGIRDGLNLGFDTFEVYLSPESCRPYSPSFPDGYYQNLSFCQGCTLGYGCSKSIVDIGSSPLYRDLFNLPYRNLFITIDAFNQNSPNAWSIAGSPQDTRSPQEKLFTMLQLGSLYREFYDFASFLYQNYGNSDKTIIFQTPNELDGQLVLNKGPLGVVDNENPDDYAIQNAISYLNTIQRAVDDAKAENLGKKLKIYHSCEVSNILKTIDLNRKSASSDVVPYTHCDLYGYSSWGSYLGALADPLDPRKDRLVEFVNFLKEKAPPSPDFGENNVFVSEFGAGYGGYSGVSAENAITITRREIEATTTFKLPYFMFWQLYDNDCSTLNPTVDQCRGYGIRRADGTLSRIYTEVMLKYLYGMEVVSENIPAVLRKGQQYTITATLKNTGEFIWKNPDEEPVNYFAPAFFIEDLNGNVKQESGWFTLSKRVVLPGETVGFTGSFAPSSDLTPGSYRLRLDMVHNGYTWFSQKGVPVFRKDLSVTD